MQPSPQVNGTSIAVTGLRVAPPFPTPPLQLLLVTTGTPFRRYPTGYGFRGCRTARTGNSGPNLQMNQIGATLTGVSGIPIDSSTNNFTKEVE